MNWRLRVRFGKVFGTVAWKKKSSELRILEYSPGGYHDERHVSMLVDPSRVVIVVCRL